MRLAKIPILQDDLSLDLIKESIQKQIEHLQKSISLQELQFADKKVSKEKYIESLQKLLDFSSQEDFFFKIEKEFEFYEVYGSKKWGQAFVTGYYEPVILASRVPTEVYSQALYKSPSDIYSLDLGLFGAQFFNARKMRARIEGEKIYPYYSREEIDSHNKLKNKNLEICWVDPIDAFFLQIQGSGTVEFEDGSSLFVNYAEKNGREYIPLGKFLDHIPKEEINSEVIENYLRALSPEKRQELLNKNPSYVFFEVSDNRAVTSSGISALAGRTIATDKNFFPKGALAFLMFDKPIFSSDQSVQPAKTESVGRFVFDQDVGGVIKGGGRVDLFWGRGALAKKYAGALKSQGKLYYLVPKN